jgi:hypothetical protein
MPSRTASRRPRPAAEPAAAAPPDTIDAIIADLLGQQSRLSALLDAINDPAELLGAARLFAVHGQNAARLGQLLRARRALSGASADGLLDAIGKALDEISTELGVRL